MWYLQIACKHCIQKRFVVAFVFENTIEVLSISIYTARLKSRFSCGRHANWFYVQTVKVSFFPFRIFIFISIRTLNEESDLIVKAYLATISHVQMLFHLKEAQFNAIKI